MVKMEPIYPFTLCMLGYCTVKIKPWVSCIVELSHLKFRLLWQIDGCKNDSKNRTLYCDATPLFGAGGKKKKLVNRGRPPPRGAARTARTGTSLSG